MRSNILRLGLILGVGFLTACSGSGQKSDKKSSTETFSDFADEEGFGDKHDEPSNQKISTKGKMEKLPIPGGEDANLYRVKLDEGNKYILVMHEWWGLNDQVKAEADRFYEKVGNATVIALDLYDGNVATTREEAKGYMQGADEERILSIINAVFESLPEDAIVGTVGWCFGGGWSLRAAIAGGERVNACVMYYGMPIQDVEELKRLNSDVLFIYGEKDQWINSSVAEKFQQQMDEAGKKVEVMAFEADHAFANPSSDRYEETAAQEANQAALDYFEERFQ